MKENNDGLSEANYESHLLKGLFTSVSWLCGRHIRGPSEVALKNVNRCVSVGSFPLNESICFLKDKLIHEMCEALLPEDVRKVIKVMQYLGLHRPLLWNVLLLFV
jgi:hypothetical protein